MGAIIAWTHRCCLLVLAYTLVYKHLLTVNNALLIIALCILSTFKSDRDETNE